MILSLRVIVQAVVRAFSQERFEKVAKLQCLLSFKLFTMHAHNWKEDCLVSRCRVRWHLFFQFFVSQFADKICAKDGHYGHENYAPKPGLNTDII